ncbi:hypothetical protein RM543_06410 [Roseicyclus sp. F158]|uniref:Dual OB-containing domain-containing protein n=1 Tax=Tropicimonas omnivorans TaxID=3075590 RepID=A0ABU3DF32_9RHOB|nr:hypothetical protein [Roseicyclus sp. F158]MDT0682309.1 hypothetical protein [Roseicyclus sp. F158]
MSLKALREQFADGQSRQILVTETTRMSGDLVCVAGLDLDSGQMVRPLQGNGSNWEEGKWVDEGYMVVGNVLSLSLAEQVTSAFPHASEDFRVKAVGIKGKANGSELYTACAETSTRDIDSVFDGCLIDRKYTEANSRCRSLHGLEISAAKIDVSVFYDKIQVSFRDRWRNWYNVPVTELLTKKTGDPEAGCKALSERLESAGRSIVVLRLGLARAWDGGSQHFNPKRCYMQLNGVIIPA